MQTDLIDKQLKPKVHKTYIAKIYKLSPFIKLLPKVLKLIEPVFYTFVIAYIFKFILAALNVKKAQYIGGIVDIFSFNRSIFDMKHLFMGLVIYYAAYIVLTRIINRLNARIISKLNTEVRADLYKNVLEKDMEFFDKKNPYAAIDEVNKGIEGVQNLATNRIHGTFNPILKVIATFTLLNTISTELTMIVLIITPFRIYFQDLKKKRREKLAKEKNREMAQSFEIPGYSKDHIFLIKAFSTEEKERQNFIEKANNIPVPSMKKKKNFWDLKVITSSLGWGFQLLVLSYGGFLMFRDKLSLGQLITFNMYFSTFVRSISSSLVNMESLLKSLKQSENLFKILEYEPKIKVQDSRAVQKPEIRGDISVNRVSFNYLNQSRNSMLSDISLRIRAGETVGFTGSNGTGKSSLLHLLQRLYEPLNGEILIDGTNIKDIEIRWLHKNIGFVPQKPIILDGTIMENMTYGVEEYTSEQLNKAMSIIGLDFINDRRLCPQGLQTRIGDRGVKLSGLQVQKIAFVRALLDEPRVLILDDVSIGLEDENREELDSLVRKIMGNRNQSVIVATNSESVLRECDRIYSFGEGRVEEMRRYT